MSILIELFLIMKINRQNSTERDLSAHPMCVKLAANLTHAQQLKLSFSAQRFGTKLFQIENCAKLFRSRRKFSGTGISLQPLSQRRGAVSKPFKIAQYGSISATITQHRTNYSITAATSAISTLIGFTKSHRMGTI